MRPRRIVVLSAYVGSLALALTGCVTATSGSNDPGQNATAKQVKLAIGDNSILGGKNSAGAKWITDYVIPGFEKAEKAKGVDVTVTFQPSGAEDAAYKQRQALDLKTGGGPDVFSLDGTLLGEFAQAGYIKPLDQVVGQRVDGWDGWSQVPDAVKQNAQFEGKRYGIPAGTDGRVLYFNKKVFAQAGLPADWQPKSWADILSAGEAVKKVSGVTPIQLNAGTSMGEATSATGFLPMLAGSGAQIYDQTSHKWQGATPQVKNVLSFYQSIYGTGLGDPKLQQDQNGRDESFAEFSQGKIGILLESDYLWRAIICPDKSTCHSTSMPDRNETVGYALIPSMNPGSGVKGQNFVSMSGGGDYILNPNTKFPQQAWDLMQFMSSADAVKARLGKSAQITQRADVNREVLAGDPLLSFVSSTVLPLTGFRPGLAAYSNSVTQAIQQATGDAASGKGVDAAAATYETAMEKAVGPASVQNQ